MSKPAQPVAASFPSAIEVTSAHRSLARLMKAALCVSLMAAAAGLSAPSKAGPSVYPAGVTIYKPDLAYRSLVIFSAPDGKTHVIDLLGNEVHRWNYAGLPGDIIAPALAKGEPGHVLLQIESNGDKRGGILANKTVGELDWSGRVIWSWGSQAPDGSARQNHDWARLANGNTLLLYAQPRVIKELGDKEVADQGIYEIEPNGEIVWQWAAADHLSEFGLSPAGLEFLRNAIAEYPGLDPWGYLEINDMQPLGSNKWFDAGDARFHPDNIVIDSRKANFVAIISRETGKIVWRLGPYAENDVYSRDRRILNQTVPRPADQLAGQHNAHLIAKGLPGEGNLLLLDNQGGSGYPPVPLGIYAGSRILEINPVTQQIVWQYTAADSGLPSWSFFTSFVGSVQRLPNGNTLINEGMNGRIFQVTPSGEIVWEYINPYTSTTSSHGKVIKNSLVYRARAVPFDWVPSGTAHNETPSQPAN